MRWILVSRPEGELGPLPSALAPHRIQVFPYPVLCEVGVEDEEGWRHVSRELAHISALLVTSRRAPRHFAEQSQRRGMWPRMAAIPVAAVGAATARACGRCGLKVQQVGSAGGAALAEELVTSLKSGQAVLHPTSRHRREEAHHRLSAAGAEVIPLVVYDMEEGNLNSLPPLPDEPPAAVLLTSPRAAAAYLRAAPRRLQSAPHFALGATTAKAAAHLGLSTRILARPDPLALVEELCLT